MSHELADVLLYLVQMADSLDIDLLQAAQDKLVLKAIKYPVEPPPAASSADTVGFPASDAGTRP